MTQQIDTKNKSINHLPPFIREREELAGHARFRVGGPADFFCEPGDLHTLKAALRFAKDEEIPFFILGEGSNLVIQDGGIRGLVIRLGKGFREIRISDGTLCAGCGASLPRVCHHAAHSGLLGLEGLVGIPGTVGGAVIMNAGAGEDASGSFLTRLSVLEGDGQIRNFGREDFHFAYRNFQWKDGTPLRERILLEACWELQPAPGDLLLEKIKEAIRTRKASQPISEASAGCIFRNPGPEIPAGRLIDEAGLKGLAVGDAVVSPIHANFIVNRGNARARDILALMGLVEERVLATHGIRLEREVCIVGEKGQR